MQKVLSVENMRKSDAQTIKNGTSGIELMYRAGKGILSAIENEGMLTPPVAILCGTGNNAGDGYVLALLLKERSIPVTLFLIEEKFSEDGGYYYKKCIEAGIEKNLLNSISPEASAKMLSGYELYVDCLLGTGFKGAPRESMGVIIDALNEIKGSNDVFVVSADINSGLNGDTGFYERCINSDLTVAIGGLKPGLMLNRAKDVCRKAVSIDIGIAPVDAPYYLWDMKDAAKFFPERKNYSNKGTYGYVALIGGSLMYSGAIRLAGKAECAVALSVDCSNAAMRSGAGVVMIAAPNSLCPMISKQILESTLYPLPEKDGIVCFDRASVDGLINRVRVIAFGMGIGPSDETKKLLSYIMENFEGTLIVDADGLNVLAAMDLGSLENVKCKDVILTPHIKEFSRLTHKEIWEINEKPIEIVKEYAKATGFKVLLKGPTTIVSDGDKVYLINRGCPGMATAGSGDVLSGIMAAVCASNKENALGAMAAAAYINGLAGELAEKEMGAVSMIASDTVNHIPMAIRNICED